jgi:hypothetical protein
MVQTTTTTAPREQSLRPFVCFLLGSAFAALDAMSTWYALRFTYLPEGNPAMRWAFEQVGLGPALVVRVAISCSALALLAWGVSARLPNHERVFNAGCRVLLMGAIVIWGVVAVSNIAQIISVRVRYGWTWQPFTS